MEEPKVKRKLNITESAIKKQKVILVIAVFCIITLFAGTSYSLLTNFDTSDNFITFKDKSGNKSISVNKIDGLIKLGKSYSKNLEDLNNIPSVVLTFTNNGKVDIANYTVKLVIDEKSSIDEKKLKYAISENLGVTYSDGEFLTDNSNIIYKGNNLEVKKSKTIYLKVWYEDEEEISLLDKYFNTNLKIEF